MDMQPAPRGLIPLKPLRGFPQDFRHPGLDHSARRFVSERYGERSIQDIESTYHRSVVSKDSLLADLQKYNRFYAKSITDDEVFKMVVRSVEKQFVPEEKLIPWTLGKVEAHPDFPKDRSPGLPWKQLGYKTKGDVLADSDARKVWHSNWRQIGMGRARTLPDTALFVRAQVCGIDREKVRAVWGYPIDVIVEEGRGFYPYLNWLKTQDAPVGYCVEIARGGMSYIDNMLKEHPPPEHTYVVTDWTEFDKSIPPWLIRTAFDIIWKAFDWTRVEDSEGKIWPVCELDSSRRFKKMIKYFINTPVRLCDGSRYQKSGGVPSGSMWTNIIDTIVNIIVTRYISYVMWGFFPTAEIYLGDDSVYISRGMVDLDLISDLAKKYFGMVLNVKKSYVTANRRNVHFIGYYNRDGRPFKPQDFLIASFIYPERHVETQTIRLARAVGQMWSTCDGASAIMWRKICQDIMDLHGVTEADMKQHILTHPSYFKYLRTVGINLGEISIPPAGPQGYVYAVDPPLYSLRPYIVKEWDYDAIFNSQSYEDKFLRIRERDRWRLV